jgi:hypothetical protein
MRFYNLIAVAGAMSLLCSCSNELTREKAQKALDKAFTGATAKEVLKELDRGRKIVQLQLNNFPDSDGWSGQPTAYTGPGRAFFVQNSDGKWSLTGLDFIQGQQAGRRELKNPVQVE